MLPAELPLVLREAMAVEIGADGSTLPPPREVTEPLRLPGPSFDEPSTGLRLEKKLLPGELAASAAVCREGMKGFGGGAGGPSLGDVEVGGNCAVRGESPADGGGESMEGEKDDPLPLELREVPIAMEGAKVETKRSAMGVRVARAGDSEGEGEVGLEGLYIEGV